jgi:hypothetical protein
MKAEMTAFKFLDNVPLASEIAQRTSLVKQRLKEAAASGWCWLDILTIKCKG